MNIITLLFLCAGFGLVWFLARLWQRLPIPRFSKVMLTLSLVFVLFGIVLLWTSSVELGTALIAVGSVLSSVESYVRRKKSTDTTQS